MDFVILKNEDQRDKSLQALVFKFQNKPLGDRKISRARNEIATMHFHSENGMRHHSLSYGVWLNSPGNNTSLGIGDTQELLMMCVLDNELVTFEDRRGVSHNCFDAFSYFQENVIDGLEIVSVTVIDQDTQLVSTASSKYGVMVSISASPDLPPVRTGEGDSENAICR